MANSKQRVQPTIASKNTNCDVLEFISHMSLEEANKLSINDKIDYRNIVGLCIPSIIIDKDDSHLMIRNIAYEWDPNKQYEFWIDYKDTDTLLKLATYESISKRLKHRFLDLKIGDYIDMRPVTVFAPDREHKLWTIGEVVEFDTNNSGQVKVVYIVDNCEQYQWSHLDNTDEIQPLQTKQTLSKPPIIIIAIDEQQENNIRHQKKMSGHKRERKNKSATKTQEPKAKKRKLMRENDKKKEKQNDKSISTNCYLCGVHCSNLDKYKLHLRTHNKKAKQNVQKVQTFEDSYYISVNCHFCNKYFNNISKYSYHLKAHYNSDESKTWTHCDLGCTVNKDHEIQTSTFTGIFKGTQAFLAHIATHTFDRPFRCNVAGCENQTSSKGAHKAHWKRYHEIRN